MIVMGNHMGSSTVVTTGSIFPWFSRLHFLFVTVGSIWRTEPMNVLHCKRILHCKEGKDSYFTYCKYGFTYFQLHPSSFILVSSFHNVLGECRNFIRFTLCSPLIFCKSHISVFEAKGTEHMSLNSTSLLFDENWNVSILAVGLNLSL